MCVCICVCLYVCAYMCVQSSLFVNESAVSQLTTVFFSLRTIESPEVTRPYHFCTG